MAEVNAAKKYKNLVIIGSGPIGMISALVLKDHFENVILLERQSKENFLRKYGFTFPVVFSPAAIRILESVGAWAGIISERSEYFGVVIHKRILGRDFNFTTSEDNVYAHWRNHIIAKLYEHVLEQSLSIQFNARVEDIDFENSICTEENSGELAFDLLLGADGINSQTRGLLAKAHPDYPEDSFKMTFLDNWYAYRLPSVGRIREKFSGGENFYASSIFMDNLAAFPDDKFRIITTAMRQPKEEISVLIKHSAEVDLVKLRRLNESYFGPLVESEEALDLAWAAGYPGRFDQVDSPTFILNNVLLVGDAAHGFESTGDLINMGVTSVGSFYEIFRRHSSIRAALKEYDETVGESLRYYGHYALRRSQEKISFEVASIELAARLGLTKRHPVLYGTFDDNFEPYSYIKAFQKDVLISRLFIFGLGIFLVLLIMVIF